MAALKLYPLGIQTFERIIKENRLYVDKTEYIYRMTHCDGTYFFLSRPRRFGKSLLTSTFKSYFEGRKDLFKGLAIEKRSGPNTPCFTSTCRAASTWRKTSLRNILTTD